MVQWPKSIGRAWRAIEGVHTALWLWSLLSGGALAVFASAFEGVPVAYAITAGAVFAAAIAHFVNQAKDWFRADVAKSIDEVAETGSEPITQATPLMTAELNNSYFKNRDVYIRELIVDEFRVTNRVFEDCVIHGPAVLGFLRSVLDNCKFVGPSVDSVVFPVWPQRSVVGALLVKDCIFRRCKFRNIGVIGVQEPKQSKLEEKTN